MRVQVYHDIIFALACIAGWYFREQIVVSVNWLYRILCLLRTVGLWQLLAVIDTISIRKCIKIIQGSELSIWGIFKTIGVRKCIDIIQCIGINKVLAIISIISSKSLVVLKMQIMEVSRQESRQESRQVSRQVSEPRRCCVRTLFSRPKCKLNLAMSSIAMDGSAADIVDSVQITDDLVIKLLKKHRALK